jgi:HEXXH motif-containing protein
MEEIGSLLYAIIPFDVSQRKHNSGSYSDAVGHIVMSYPEDVEMPELVILEAIIHEYNHNKYNLIAQTDAVILND